ncbi:MAG TPA: LysR substrate-binding domain-containing protein [Rhodanobacteraceae bacterium]|nr:LysR substrate-binding domain-containing protein [Rhodanobacteraceae bacterium]
MTLVQLRYLVAIADAGLNITLAATRVHATQPGLSKQLKQLEDELGFRLFTRAGKSLSAVTPAGAQVLERARVILAEALNIRAIAANLRKEAQGDLRIATTHTQARFALPNAIAALRQAFPDVGVHLQPLHDSDVLPRLESGHVDFAVISTPGKTPDGGLALPAFRWQRVILAPADHPIAKRKRPPTLAELAALPIISYDSSRSAGSSLRRAFAEAGLQPQINLTAGDADLIKTYVRAGLGIGVLAEMAILPSDSDLVAISAEHLFPECTAWVVIRPGTVLRDYAYAFIDELAPHLDRRDITRALAGDGIPDWGDIPNWQQRLALAA